MSAGRLKATSWVLMAAGAVLALVLRNHSGEQGALVGALAWAVLAGVGVSLLLGSWGRRLVGGLQLLLAVGLGATALAASAHSAVLAAAALVLAGALVQLLTAQRWKSPASRYARGPVTGQPQSDLELWKSMDAGIDPTRDEIGGSLAIQETMDVPRSSKEDR